MYRKEGSHNAAHDISTVPIDLSKGVTPLSFQDMEAIRTLNDRKSALDEKISSIIEEQDTILKEFSNIGNQIIFIISPDLKTILKMNMPHVPPILYLPHRMKFIPVEQLNLLAGSIRREMFILWEEHGRVKHLIETTLETAFRKETPIPSPSPVIIGPGRSTKKGSAEEDVRSGFPERSFQELRYQVERHSSAIILPSDAPSAQQEPPGIITGNKYPLNEFGSSADEERELRYFIPVEAEEEDYGAEMEMGAVTVAYPVEMGQKVPDEQYLTITYDDLNVGSNREDGIPERSSATVGSLTKQEPDGPSPTPSVDVAGSDGGIGKWRSEQPNSPRSIMEEREKSNLGSAISILGTAANIVLDQSTVFSRIGPNISALSPGIENPAFPISKSKVPMYRDGGVVERTGFAYVHEGEIVVPRDQLTSIRPLKISSDSTLDPISFPGPFEPSPGSTRNVPAKEMNTSGVSAEPLEETIREAIMAKEPDIERRSLTLPVTLADLIPALTVMREEKCSPDAHPYLGPHPASPKLASSIPEASSANEVRISRAMAEDNLSSGVILSSEKNRVPEPFIITRTEHLDVSKVGKGQGSNIKFNGEPEIIAFEKTALTGDEGRRGHSDPHGSIGALSTAYDTLSILSLAASGINNLGTIDGFSFESIITAEIRSDTKTASPVLPLPKTYDEEISLSHIPPPGSYGGTVTSMNIEGEKLYPGRSVLSQTDKTVETREITTGSQTASGASPVSNAVEKSMRSGLTKLWVLDPVISAIRDSGLGSMTIPRDTLSRQMVDPTVDLGVMQATHDPVGPVDVPRTLKWKYGTIRKQEPLAVPEGTPSDLLNNFRTLGRALGVLGFPLETRISGQNPSRQKGASMKYPTDNIELKASDRMDTGKETLQYQTTVPDPGPLAILNMLSCSVTVPPGIVHHGVEGNIDIHDVPLERTPGSPRIGDIESHERGSNRSPVAPLEEIINWTPGHARRENLALSAGQKGLGTEGNDIREPEVMTPPERGPFAPLVAIRDSARILASVSRVTVGRLRHMNSQVSTLLPVLKGRVTNGYARDIVYEFVDGTEDEGSVPLSDVDPYDHLSSSAAVSTTSLIRSAVPVPAPPPAVPSALRVSPRYAPPPSNIALQESLRALRDLKTEDLAKQGPDGRKEIVDQRISERDRSGMEIPREEIYGVVEEMLEDEAKRYGLVFP